MRDAGRVKLLFGPYAAPRLRRGDRAICLFKDCDVVVTSWTDARISWPRGRPVDVPRTHPSLLVDEELARAVRLESAAAIRHWWGVSEGVVHRWRKVLGVTRTNNPGSVRRQRAASEAGAAVTRGEELPPGQVERRRRTARELDLGRRCPRGITGRGGRRSSCGCSARRPTPRWRGGRGGAPTPCGRSGVPWGSPTRATGGG
jgi:hypothetical protein